MVLEFGTEHLQNDTGKLEQTLRRRVTIIGQIRSVTPDEVILAPLIMGAPSLEHANNIEVGIPMERLVWYAGDW